MSTATFGTGYDYTSMVTWEATEQADLVTAAEDHILEFYNDGSSGSGVVSSWPTLDISGWTCSSAYKIIWRLASGVTAWNTVTKAGIKFTDDGDDSYAFVLRSGVRLYIERGFGYTFPSIGNSFAFDGGQYLWIDGGHIYSTKQLNSPSTSQPTLITNTLIEIDYANNLACTKNQTLKNSTIIGKTGMGAYSGDILAYSCTLTNCAIYNSNTKTTYNTCFSCSGDYNAQNNNGSAAPPGANSINTLTTADFENYAGGDYHAASGGVLIGAGTNLYSEFTEDIDGDTWPASGAWDIGFDYRVASGGATANGTGTGTALATGSSQADSTGASTGTSVVSGTGESTYEAVASSTASASVNGVGTSDNIQEGVGSSTGTSTTTATGESTCDADASAAGTSTVTATGTSENFQDGAASSSGVGTASSTGASYSDSTSSSSGICTVTAVAEGTTDSVAASDGTSVVSAVGASNNDSTASASGSATVSAEGTTENFQDGAGYTSGIATVLATGAWYFDATASSSGTGTVSGVGTSVTSGEGVGSSSGTSTVIGYYDAYLAPTERTFTAYAENRTFLAIQEARTFEAYK